MKRKRKPKVVLGDLNSLEACSAELLEQIFRTHYIFLIPRKLVEQLSEERQQLISHAAEQQQVRLLNLSSREKMKAMRMANRRVSFDDACSAYLAHREKAILILHDSYWHQPGVRIKGVIMPPPSVLRFPIPLMFAAIQFHSIFDHWSPVYYNTEKAG